MGQRAQVNIQLERIRELLFRTSKSVGSIESQEQSPGVADGIERGVNVDPSKGYAADSG